MTKLRETIAYNKNLITGSETFKKKYKSIDAPMVNTMTVELYDAETGEKVYEAKAENVVNNIVSKMAYMDFFYNRIKGAIGTTGYSPPFQVIVLTNSAQLEIADQPYMLGTVIGWADKASSYSGTDNLRGTINLSETQLDINKDGTLHFVFDFPTNAANGTFQTIWWHFSAQPVLYLCKSSVAWSSFSNLLFYYDGNVYDVSANKKYNADLTNPVTWTPGIVTGSGFYHDGTYLWAYDSANIKKYSADLTTLISTTAYTKPTAIGTETFESICTNGTDTLWLVTTLGKIVKYTIGNYTNGTMVKDMGSYGQNYVGLMYFGGKLYFGYKYNLVEFDASYNITNTFIMPTNQSYASCYGLFCDNVNHIIYFYGSNGFNLYSIFPTLLYSPPAAQNLLAAPVTKTPTNTMKIQYDFQVQKVL